MALNSRLKTVVDKLLRTDVTEKNVYKKSDIAAGVAKVLAELKSILGSPANDSKASMIAWGEKQSPGMLESLNNEEALEKLKDYMDEKASEFFRQDYWQNRSKEAVNIFQKELVKARVEIYTTLDIYAGHASNYSKETIGKSGAGVVRSTRAVATKTLLTNTMSGQELKNYISGMLGISATKIATLQQKYLPGQPKVSNATKNEDQKVLNAILAKFESLPEELKSYLLLKTDKKIASVLLLAGGKKKGDRLDPNEKEILSTLAANRVLLLGVKWLAGKVEPKNETYDASRFRYAKDILETIDPFIRKGNYKGITDMVASRMPKTKKGSAKLLKDLKGLNIYAGILVDCALKRGSVSSIIRSAQEGFVGLENEKELRTFTSNSSEVIKSLSNTSLMDRMKKIGFEPKTFFKTRQGIDILRSFRTDMVDLLSGSERSLLKTFRDRPRIKEYEAKPFDPNKSKRNMERKIRRALAAHVQRERVNLDKEISNRYGRELKEILGKKDFSQLIDTTISHYYDSAHRSYILGFLGDSEEKNARRFDISTANLQNISTFANTARKFKIKTLKDFEDKFDEELKDIRNKTIRPGSKDSVIEWAYSIQNFTGVKRSRNQLVVNAIDEILNAPENHTYLEIYVRLNEETKHMGDTENHEDKTKKQDQIDKRGPGRNKEIDIHRRSRNEEKRRIREVDKIMRSKSPSIDAIRKVLDVGKRSKALVENPVLREMFREINNINLRKGFTEELKKQTTTIEIENENLQKLFMKEFDKAGWRRIKKDKEYREAKKAASTSMYSERYTELQGLFQRQDGKFDSTRNSALTQHIHHEELKKAAFTESLGKDEQGNMADQVARGIGIAREEAADRARDIRNSAGYGNAEGSTPYMTRMSAGNATLATMIEQAQTQEDLDEVRTFISGVIPMRQLKNIEKLNGNPSYATKLDGEGNTTEKVYGLQSFIGFHEQRLNEVEALKKIGAP